MGEIAGEMNGGFIKNCLAAGDILVNENYSGYAGAICGQVFFTGDNSEEKCYISDCKYLNKYPFAAMVRLQVKMISRSRIQKESVKSKRKYFCRGGDCNRKYRNN